jgi:outer membrane protein OmpA-like peptidoglycan-associated protein
MKKPEAPDCGEVNIAFDGATLDPETGSMEVLDATMIVFDRDRGQVVAEVPLKFMRGISVTFGPGNYVVGYLVREKVVKVEDDSLILLEPIHFDFDKADIRVEDSKEVLDDLVSVLSEHDEIVLLEVGGHTDERGSASYNDDLSKRRTQAVVDYLADAGIDPARLVPVGYGERHLLEENCEAEDCHERNRRVVFTILEGSSD